MHVSDRDAGSVQLQGVLLWEGRLAGLHSLPGGRWWSSCFGRQIELANLSQINGRESSRDA